MGMYVRIRGKNILNISPKPLKPVKGTEVKYVDWLNHAILRYLYVDEKGEIREYDHEEADRRFLEQLKSSKLEELNNFFTNFIESAYSDIKQKSDLFDVEYHRSVLLSINTNYTADSLNKEAIDYAQDILQGNTTLNEIVSSKPEQEQIHWDQFLKSVVRNMWYNKNKEIYRQLKKQILEASSFDELTQVRWSEDGFLPFPVF